MTTVTGTVLVSDFTSTLTQWTEALPSTGEICFVNDGQIYKMLISQINKDVVGLSNVLNIKNNPNATTDPTFTDDVSAGYSVGSYWINISSKTIFICSDNTTVAAVWSSISGGSMTGAQIKALYEAESDTNAFTDAFLSKLSNIEEGAEVNAVNSVAGKTGVVVLTKDDVGLDQIVNILQLTVGANDFEQFPEKTIPANNDRILLEDSADSYNKKYLKVSNIPGTSAGVTSFGPTGSPRTGVVNPASGDYTADQVTETASRVFMTPSQVTQLSGLSKNVANGVAGLDASGQISVDVLPDGLGSGLTYKGTWDASTNTPTLASSTGTSGDMYIVSVSGATALNGITSWNVHDWVIFNGTVWTKIDYSSTYTTIATQTEAEEHVNNANMMTPLRTYQQLEAVQALPSQFTVVTDSTYEITSNKNTLIRCEAGASQIILPKETVTNQVLISNRSGGSIEVLPYQGVPFGGAYFNGSTYVDLTLASLTDFATTFSKFTFSLWFSPDSLSGLRHLISSFNSLPAPAGVFELDIAGDHYLEFYMRSTAGTDLLRRRIDLTVANVMYHFVLSADLSVPQFKSKLNGVTPTYYLSGYTPALAAGSVTLDSTNLRIGGRSTVETANFIGNIAQVFIDIGTYIDLDVEENLAKFYNAGVAGMGSNGWKPFGSGTADVPSLFMNNDSASFSTLLNQSYTGTVTGTLADMTIDVDSDPAYTIAGSGTSMTLASAADASFSIINESPISRYHVIGG